MSYNDYIRNLLNIKDKNIYFNENIIQEKVIKGRNTKIIFAILTYIPNYCPLFGVVNESHNDIIKCGFKSCNIKIPKVSNCDTILKLHKQRFYCNIVTILLLLKLLWLMNLNPFLIIPSYKSD